MEGLKVGTREWAGDCLDTGNGDTVGTEGGAESGKLEWQSGVLG